MHRNNQNNCVFLYGLPANDVTSNQIRQKFKDIAQIELKQNNPPQIRRDFNKPEWSAIVKLENEEEAKKACNVMRFFKWYDEGHPKNVEIRTLPYDPDMKNRDDPENHAKNVFIRQLPADMTHSQLFDELVRSFSTDDLKSVKVSMDPEKQKSRKYGFASFNNKEKAQSLIRNEKIGQNGQEILVHAYNPKNRQQMRKVFNNIVVKGFAQDPDRVNEPAYQEDRENYVKNIFKDHGEITSVKVTNVKSKRQENDGKLMAFVCFRDPDSAQKVVELFKDKEVDGVPLYVAEALTKQALAKEIYKFKMSKKRCNLFVKGFPADFTEDQLREYFASIAGPDQIESLKIEKDKNEPNKAKFAFVCFKTPDIANHVRQQITNGNKNMIAGQKITANNYELKEVRQMQMQEAVDRADYQKATSANTNPSAYSDQLLQKPELFNALIGLFSHMQNRGFGVPGRQMQNKGPRHPGQNNNMMRQQHMMRGQPVPQQRPMPQQPNMMQPPMGGMPPQPGMMQPPMGGMPQQPNMMQMQMMSQNPDQARFHQSCSPIIPGVIETNENARELVGEKIYEFVCIIAGEELAPKITGMLIDLPFEEMRQYLGDYNLFMSKVSQAQDLLRKQGQE